MPDWQRTAEELSERLGRAAGGDHAAIASLHGDREQLADLLARLRDYYEDVPAETAWFARDQALLAEVVRTSAERVALINDLRQALLQM